MVRRRLRLDQWPDATFGCRHLTNTAVGKESYYRGWIEGWQHCHSGSGVTRRVVDLVFILGRVHK